MPGSLEAAHGCAGNPLISGSVSEQLRHAARGPRTLNKD